MVDRLSSFAAEVTRVAREVGSEGRLGGQAEVADVSGTWKRLTENVNELAGNLTRQVHAIAEVTSAVAEGDLTRSITVEAPGEVGELRDNINAMVESLRATTRANEDQEWLASSLAGVSRRIRGIRELPPVARLLMREVPPLVDAQYGSFFLAQEQAGAPSRWRSPRTGCPTAPTRAPAGSGSASPWSAKPRPDPPGMGSRRRLPVGGFDDHGSDDGVDDVGGQGHRPQPGRDGQPQQVVRPCEAEPMRVSS
ncbi:HAMP domain-containing protein [Streptomyces sp. NBC_00454]|uniref:HAMP domain-containing protein n=1 Tax=Streptomyces sp. NBC_00454 TaxID=2975747 RepID=UPI00352D10E4